MKLRDALQNGFILLAAAAVVTGHSSAMADTAASAPATAVATGNAPGQAGNASVNTAATDINPVAKELERIARASIETNITPTTTGSYLSAGNNQFRGLWTRDFCFASPGLIAIGRQDVVRDQLSRILSFAKMENGVVPRYMDNKTVAIRYADLMMHKRATIREPLKANYSGGSFSKNLVIDSNSLVLIAAADYVRKTGDVAWWNEHEEELVRVYRFHDHVLRDGLIEQGRAADWQDSVKRTGRTFYTNLLYYVASERVVGMPRFGVTPEWLAALKKRIIDTFYDPTTGLYFSVEKFPQISLDALLLAVDYGFFAPDSDEARSMWAALKRHPLWTKNNGFPGFNTFPDYPHSWVETMPDLTGVRHYHDRIYWSWLVALSAKVAYLMEDTRSGDAIVEQLTKLAVRDGAISEIWQDRAPYKRYVTSLYTSERPFSWGAGLTLDMLYARRKLIETAPPVEPTPSETILDRALRHERR